jgi:hypothetical protein
MKSIQINNGITVPKQYLLWREYFKDLRTKRAVCLYPNFDNLAIYAATGLPHANDICEQTLFALRSYHSSRTTNNECCLFLFGGLWAEVLPFETMDLDKDHKEIVPNIYSKRTGRLYAPKGKLFNIKLTKALKGVKCAISL